MARVKIWVLAVMLVALSCGLTTGALLVASERQSFELSFVCVIALASVLLPIRHALWQAAFVVLLGAGIAVRSAVVLGNHVAMWVEFARWGVLATTVILLSVVLQRMARSLHSRTHVAEAVASLGHQALSVSDPDELLKAALQEAVDLLGADYGTALRRLPDGRLRVAAELGPDPLPAGTILTVAETGSYALHIVNSREPFMSADLRHDERITPPIPLLERGIVSGVAVPVLGVAGALGVLAVHSRRRRNFTSAEVAVVQTLANVVATAWEQAENRQLLHYRSLHDPLTGLPNRALFLDRVKFALARRNGEHPPTMCVTIMLVDLDGFKSVNDSYGHAAGDGVLCTVSRRFSGALRPGDSVARFGGDEFAVLCEQVPDEKTAITLGQRLLKAVDNPLPVGSSMVSIGVSVGITLSQRSTSSGITVEALLGEADAALYRAKRLGRGRLELFNENLKVKAQNEFRLRTELQHAIDADELALHYQPIRSTAGRSLLAVEALVRWNHPRRGMLPPAEFLPLAEATGLIVPLGSWVLRTACSEVATWQRRNPRPSEPVIQVAVNLSARQLEDPTLPEQIKSTIRDTALADGALMLELTETALLDGGDDALSALTLLRDAGAQLSLDDFGTGYSSLVHLARFPIAALKIDQTFVAGLGHDRRSSAIVSAVIALGNELHLRVIAEGVETEDQLHALSNMECDAVQGYLLDRPQPLPT